MLKYLQNISILYLILNVNISFAQLEAHKINGDGWAKGNLVEIGINSKGIYGANTSNKPSSFHNNRETVNNLFGFIANPLNDGWKDYDGDFFSPGDPEEGFSIEVNYSNYSNNHGINESYISGEIIDAKVILSECFENIAQILWEGNVEGLNIKRYYSVTENGLFIQMTTFIKNLSNTPKKEVYFMHNVDPDNNVTISGSFDTDIEIVSQASSPTDKTSIVTASQMPLLRLEDMDGSNVSFYANNDKARVSYGGFINRSASDVWNGTGLVNTEGSTSLGLDEAISIAFYLGDIPINESVRFTYYYILKEIDETFEPFIVNLFTENPTLCLGNDGKIIFSGLDISELYTINYLKNGIAIPSQTYIANSNGEIIIENLSSGNYTNIFISYKGCDKVINTEINLQDPKPTNFTLSSENLTTCFDFDGSITIHDLTPNTVYNFSYLYNGILVELDDLSASSVGEILLPNLDEGVYSDFSLEQYNCYTSSNEIIKISRPEESTVTFSSNSTFLSKNDTIEVIPSVAGNYLYSIDNGPPQSSPIFTNVSSGTHNIRITDTYGCEIGRFEKTVAQYPKVFTPNNDGVNDIWKIIGLNELKDPKIYIYNRYGKLIKQLNENSLGWDGTLNGSTLSPDDYWFKVTYIDDKNNNQEFTSHFTLKL